MGKLKQAIRGLLVTMGIALMALPAVTSSWNLHSNGDVIQVSAGKKGGCQGGRRGGCRLVPDTQIYELSKTTLGPRGRNTTSGSKGRFLPEISDRSVG